MTTETQTKPWAIVDHDIDPDSENMVDALGIPQERCDQINAFLSNMDPEDSMSLSDVLRKIGNYAENPEEYAMMMLSVGRSLR